MDWIHHRQKLDTLDLTGFRLDETIGRDWVTRLRSGIGQLKGRLGADNGNRCCLGVLCDIGVEAGEITVRTVQGSHGLLMDLEYGGSLAQPPPSWTALAFSWDDENGRQNLVMLLSHLAGANDAGMPFSEIADWIESHLLPPVTPA